MIFCSFFRTSNFVILNNDQRVVVDPRELEVLNLERLGLGTIRDDSLANLGELKKLRDLNLAKN